MAAKGKEPTLTTLVPGQRPITNEQPLLALKLRVSRENGIFQDHVQRDSSPAMGVPECCDTFPRRNGVNQGQRGETHSNGEACTWGQCTGSGGHRHSQSSHIPPAPLGSSKQRVLQDGIRPPLLSPIPTHTDLEVDHLGRGWKAGMVDGKRWSR